ncbi:hypothetical protein HDU93_006793 [Gonapodya sp. JEL0774]|nr:hypothetical protein HDU93_006793 [Gonapodya sp. JEL0774]
MAFAVGDFLKVIAPSVRSWKLKHHLNAVLLVVGVCMRGEIARVLDLQLDYAGEIEWVDALLTKCYNLESLLLHGVTTSLTLRDISLSSRLRRLWLTVELGHTLHSDVYKKIGQLKYLEWLAIDGDRYKDGDGKLDHLHGLVVLSRLVLTGESGYTPSFSRSITPLLRKVGQNLITLDITGCKDGVQPLSMPTVLAELCPVLQELIISKCGVTNVSSVTFYMLAFPSLRTLGVDGAALVHDEVSAGLLKLALSGRPMFSLVADKVIATKLGLIKGLRWSSWKLVLTTG